MESAPPQSAEDQAYVSTAPGQPPLEMFGLSANYVSEGVFQKAPTRSVKTLGANDGRSQRSATSSQRGLLHVRSGSESPSIKASSTSSTSKKSGPLSRLKHAFDSHSHLHPDSARTSISISVKANLEKSTGERSRTDTLIRESSPLALVENEEYDELLESSVHGLQTDFVSGARQMADASLSHLAGLMDLAASTTRRREELWEMAVKAAKQLSYARPSMSAAITSCLLRALDEINTVWTEEEEKGMRTPSDLGRIAGGTIDAILKRRKEAGVQLGNTFAFWLKKYTTESLPPGRRGKVYILTLSNSSTIRTAIVSVLNALPEIHINLTILESRPRFEGADMAAQILSTASDQNIQSRLNILIAPDCTMATLTQKTDIVLLGADRISATGDVSNKIGSRAAAMCAKHPVTVSCTSTSVQVVVLSDGDKIVAPGAEDGPVERHPPTEVTEAWKKEAREQLENRVGVFGNWFEWVPSSLVDVYVTETGILNTKEVEKVGMEIGELETRIFDKEWERRL